MGPELENTDKVGDIFAITHYSILYGSAETVEGIGEKLSGDCLNFTLFGLEWLGLGWGMLRLL